MGTERAPITLGVICDIIEENWTSMNLVAEMLLHRLQKDRAAEITATSICSPMRYYISPLVKGKLKRKTFNADRFINRFWMYPQWLKQSATGYDLYHLIDHSYSHMLHYLPPHQTIVTCHDLDAFRSLIEPQQEPRPWWFKKMARHILSGFQSAARIVCDSEAVYKQVLAHKLVPPEKLRIVNIGVDPSCSPQANPAADREATRLIGPPDQSIPLLLNVASVIARKRMDVLLKVFAEVRRVYPKVRLIRVGGPFTESQNILLENLSLQDCVSILPFVERDVLTAIYRRADLVLQPSEREGFGLPVAEALACGTPVIASDIPVLREVGGEAATYCPVADIDVWCHTVTRLLREKMREPEQWKSRQSVGILQAAKFSWSEYARKMVRIYQELLP